MGAPVSITRDEFTAAELRAASSKCADGAQVRRILALALVQEGRPRHEAAVLSGMDRQTLSDWVHRYNAEGIDGLKSRKSPGRASFLTDAQKAELRALVIRGPDPAIHKVVRWRCADLRAEVARLWSVAVHENTIGAWLGELGLTRLQPRPVHPKKDAAAEKTFKKQARSGGPPGAVETGCAMIIPRGAAGKFLVDLSPAKNVAHESLRTYGW
jgi:transposase